MISALRKGAEAVARFHAAHAKLSDLKSGRAEAHNALHEKLATELRALGFDTVDDYHAEAALRETVDTLKVASTAKVVE